jgi:hypothetical protein
MEGLSTKCKIILKKALFICLAALFPFLPEIPVNSNSYFFKTIKTIENEGLFSYIHQQHEKTAYQ